MLKSAKKYSELEKELSQIRAENDILRTANEQLTADVKILNQKLQYILGQMFGKKSEKLDANQLLFLFDMGKNA